MPLIWKDYAQIWALKFKDAKNLLLQQCLFCERVDHQSKPHNFVMMAMVQDFVGGLLYCVTLNLRCKKKMYYRENYLLSAKSSRPAKNLKHLIEL